MNFKLLILDNNPDADFNLTEITEQDWKFFVEDVVLNITEGRRAHSIMGSVTIRGNKAKLKLAYQDGNYHEIVLRIDEFGVSTHNYNDKISSIWQDVMKARFGAKYSNALKNFNAEASC